MTTIPPQSANLILYEWTSDGHFVLYTAVAVQSSQLHVDTKAPITLHLEAKTEHGVGADPHQSKSLASKPSTMPPDEPQLKPQLGKAKRVQNDSSDDEGNIVWDGWPDGDWEYDFG